MSQLIRRVDFDAGYDCIRFECRHGSKRCKPGSGGSHGRHGLTARWYVVGDAGAVQFVVNFPDCLPEPLRGGGDSYPIGTYVTDLGYHALVPQYDRQPSMGACDVLGGRDCYYDGSTLNANEPFRVLCNEGGDALWEFLEAYYRATFEGGERPKGKPYPWKARK